MPINQTPKKQNLKPFPIVHFEDSEDEDEFGDEDEYVASSNKDIDDDGNVFYDAVPFQFNSGTERQEFIKLPETEKHTRFRLAQEDVVNNVENFNDATQAQYLIDQEIAEDTYKNSGFPWN